jgi:hypothetical protein
VPLPISGSGWCTARCFGFLVALAGCYRACVCGRSALAVDRPPPRRVTSILAIIIATASSLWVCNILGV